MNQLFHSEKNQTAPWLTPLRESLDLYNFPSAVLIHGQAGIGKFEFAVELAKSLLCEGLDKPKPCKQCEACHWFDTANHPDFIALVPETHRRLLPHAVYESDSKISSPIEYPKLLLKVNSMTCKFTVKNA